MFLRSKEKAEKALQEDCKIVIYSTKAFTENFERYIKIYSTKLDAEQVLANNDKNRISMLIEQFDEIAVKALVDTLVVTGYKREEKKKWKIWNWLF